MQEPQELGTVVEASVMGWVGRVLFTRCCLVNCQMSWILQGTGARYPWSELDDPVVLHRGYVPPIPEPTGLGAVVRSARGTGYQRVTTDSDDMEETSHAWHALGHWSSVQWDEIEQPVDVLFKGVDK